MVRLPLPSWAHRVCLGQRLRLYALVTSLGLSVWPSDIYAVLLYTSFLV